MCTLELLAWLLQLQHKVEKLTAQLNEEKQVCVHSLYIRACIICVCVCVQMNNCLSENQKLWKERVSTLEEKIDVTIKQKEQVRITCVCVCLSHIVYTMCDLCAVYIGDEGVEGASEGPHVLSGDSEKD